MCKMLIIEPNINALCGFLVHQYMFSPFVIVMHESLNCPVLKYGFQNHTVKVRKPNVQKLEDFSEEQQAEQTEQLSSNIKTFVDHPGKRHTVLRFKGV